MEQNAVIYNSVLRACLTKKLQILGLLSNTTSPQEEQSLANLRSRCRRHEDYLEAEILLTCWNAAATPSRNSLALQVLG